MIDRCPLPVTRHQKKSRHQKSEVTSQKKGVKEILKMSFRILLLILATGNGLLVFFSSTAFAAKSSAAFEILSQIPVQHDGRVKPFESFAREAALFMTGKRQYAGIPASELVWQWMAKPEDWNARPFIPVSFKPLADQFSLMLVKGRISPEIVHRPGEALIVDWGIGLIESSSVQYFTGLVPTSNQFL